jgi:hypothetical protein
MKGRTGGTILRDAEKMKKGFERGNYRRDSNAQVDRGLDALRAAFLLLHALGHDCGAEARAEVLRQFVELRVAVNLDGFLGCVADNVAVVAPRKMIFQLNLSFFVENAVQITGQLVKEFRAFHWLPSPLATSF